MKKGKKPYMVKIAEKICSDEEEREIIQYGLHQGSMILMNVLTLVVCGIFWRELPFILLVFLGIFLLRPYAGGYHADTELRCYLISTAVMNAAILGKKMIHFPQILLICIWIGTAAFIWIYAPVENPIHCLDENEKRKYVKNTRKILVCYTFVMALGIYLQQQYLMEVIVWIHILIGVAMIAGILKYGQKAIFRL